MKKSIFATLMLFLIPLSAQATTTIGAQIAVIRVDVSGIAYVELTTNTSGTPSCAASYPKALAFPVNTDGGKAALSALMAAKLAGKPLNIVGSGTCTNGYGNVIENLVYFEVH